MARRPNDDFVIRPAEWSAFGRAFGLSKRHQLIARRQYEEVPRKTIAKELNLAEGTVDSHCARIHKKLGVHTEGALVKKVLAFVRELRERGKRARRKRGRKKGV